VLGMVEAPPGRVTVGTDIGLCTVSDARCALLPEPIPGRGTGVVVPLLVDSRGRTWAGGLRDWVNGRDLLAFRSATGPQWTEVIRADGQSIRHATAAAEGPRGEVFVATGDAGVIRVRLDSAGAVGVRQVGAADGLSSERIRSVYVDPRDVVWIGTEDAGLCRWLQNTDQIACVGLEHGLFDDVVHAILPDDLGRLWFSGNRGLSWARRDALDAVLDGRSDGVLSIGLDERDGMASREGNGGLPHTAARDANGGLWFATQIGVAHVDPSKIPTPKLPRLQLASVRVGARHLTDAELRAGSVELESTERGIDISWSAPSLEHSRDLRFRHRLVGVDDGWTRPSTGRSARWQGIPAGDFTFEVDVGLGGVWSERPLTVLVSRRPAFVETLWFDVAITLGALAGFGLAMTGWAVRQRRKRVVLEAEVQRRTADLAEANRGLEARGEQVAAQAAKLLELNRLRTRFVADLSHELRTPLALVVGPLDDLTERLGQSISPADQQRLELIRQNAARLTVLGDQLLDVARLESGRLPLRVRRLDLGLVVSAVTERFRAAAERKGLSLVVRAPGGPLPLYADADLLDKIITNLVGNALKFTDVGGVTVVVAVNDTADDGFARVSVADTGVGIAPSALPRLFERFYQAERGDARRYDGVGIGLALVHDLVALHGGEVGVTSHQGVGSEFWFTLPRGAAHLTLDDLDLAPRAEIEVLPPVVAVEAGPADSRPDVLIVEDHPDMRAFLALHLGEWFHVREADGGVRALEAIRAHAPAAIVSDVMMPGMDGLELCRQLRADPALCNVPIVLVSAKTADDDRVTGLAIADDYLTKPVRPRELIARVQRLIRSRVGPAVVSQAVVPPEVASLAPPEPRDPDPDAADEADELEPSSSGPPPVLDPASARQLARIDLAIVTQLRDPAFGVIELSAALGMSRRQVQRELRRLTGRSPSEHLRAARMEEAHRLLRDGVRDTVSEVAADVGLSNAYFSRLYLAWHGRSPSEDLARRAGR
jgi:signal transduction histidine kinase/CheY-like chemotaxis protein/AraC-like DNA-binding protein